MKALNDFRTLTKKGGINTVLARVSTNTRASYEQPWNSVKRRPGPRCYCLAARPGVSSKEGIHMTHQALLLEDLQPCHEPHRTFFQALRLSGHLRAARRGARRYPASRPGHWPDRSPASASAAARMASSAMPGSSTPLPTGSTGPMSPPHPIWSRPNASCSPKPTSSTPWPGMSGSSGARLPRSVASCRRTPRSWHRLHPLTSTRATRSPVSSSCRAAHRRHHGRGHA